MNHAIRVHQHGGPEVLHWEEIPLPSPAGDQVLVRQKAVGINFIDIYQRSGLYPVAEMPFIPGQEGAGIIEAVGPEVIGLQPGDRVMYARGGLGAYAEARVIAEMDTLRIPEGIGFEHAAASLLRGMTVQMLIRRVIGLQEGMTILVHAAAGGVGLLLCQWAAHLGVTVIGTVGSAAKADVARENGAAHTILYREEDIVRRVRKITEGKLCNVVYDSVGKDTFTVSLDCLMRFGLMVSYGNASGKPEAIEPGLLQQKGSLFLTRPSLRDYIADLGDYQRAAVEFYELVIAGAIRIPVGQSYYLSDAARAQSDLEMRRTQGATVLIVG